MANILLGGPDFSYDEALAKANTHAQAQWGRTLNAGEVQGYLSKYGGGPGTRVTAEGLQPVLNDITAQASKMRTPPPPVTPMSPGSGPASTPPGSYAGDVITHAIPPGTPPPTPYTGPSEVPRSAYDAPPLPGAPSAPSAPSSGSAGTYDDALRIAQQYAQFYRGAPLTPDQITEFLKRYGGGPGTNVTAAGLQPILDELRSGIRSVSTQDTPPPITWTPAPGGASSPAPTATTTTTAPTTATDQATLVAYLQQWAAAHPGANPSVARDPTYWAGRIAQTHGSGAIDWGYWEGKMMTPEGAPEGTRTGGGPSPSPTPTGPMNFAQARAYVEQHIGKPLTDAQVEEAFRKFGGTRNDTFTTAGLDPVVAYFGGSGGGGTGTPPPNPNPGNTGVPGVPIDPNAAYPGNLFNDPGTQMLEDLIKARLNELFAPYNDSSLGSLQDMISKRITGLQGPVFSAPEEEAVKTKLFDQMERDRQSEIQSAIERLAFLGQGQGSGAYQIATDKVNKRFDETRAKSQNDLSVAMIDEHQRRLDEALGLSGQMYDLSSGVNDQQTARRREALGLASTLSDIPSQRLQLAEQAAGMGVNPASITDQIMKLMTNSQQQTQNAADRRASLVTGIGQIVGSILAGQNRKQAA